MNTKVPAIDEMVDGRGGVRPHWRGVLGTLTGMDHDALAGRIRRLAQAAEEDGAAPAWRCDPVPLPLTGEEFAQIDAGLVQRVRLLDAVLADLYGPQRILAAGWLPPASVFGNPEFMRAARATPDCTAAEPFMHAYAADLVRGPDGQWRVAADLTDGVPGIGYARESRRLLARVMPELFRTAPVRQLRPFFEAWGDSLQRMAPGGPGPGRAPVVALLTPGPQDPHWPEHLALSRDLACALVEARDLTVRGGVLSIKALAGLQRVDVLLRRVPGGTLDPLEVGSAPAGGITGLMDAARSGTVRILNRPGAALVESAGIAAALPILCQEVLGETLVLAGAEGCMPSRAPCAGPGGLEPQPVVLRVFVVRDGAGWRTMPGGLARVLAPGERVTDPLPAAAVLKDVWVFAQDTGLIRGPEPVLQAPVALRRGTGDMPSRVADDFYWLGRYVERLDAQARLARAGLARLARGAPLPREMAELAVLARCLHRAGLTPGEPGLGFEGEVRQNLHPRGAMAAGLGHVARLVGALRDRMTLDTHGAFTHALRTARAEVTEAAGHAGEDGLAHAMGGLQRLATTVSGVAAEGMVRGGGRLFLDLGRRVERGMSTAYMLGTVLAQPPARVEGTLRLALELCDSTITYRSRYLSVLQPAPVLDLVLADAGNPRALAFQFAECSGLLELAGDPELAAAAAAWQGRTGRLVKDVQMAPSPAAALPGAADALVAMGNGAAELSERITRRFFALLPRLQSVGLEVA